MKQTNNKARENGEDQENDAKKLRKCTATLETRKNRGDSEIVVRDMRKRTKLGRARENDGDQENDAKKLRKCTATLETRKNRGD